MAWRALLGAILVAACNVDHASTGRQGRITGAAAETTTAVVLAWSDLQAPTASLLGAVAVTEGTFDVDEILGLDLDPPVAACNPHDCVTALVSEEDPPPPDERDGPRLNSAYLIGLALGPGESPPESVALNDLVDESEAVSDDVVAVFADAEVLPGTPEWTTFETSIPMGLSLMHQIPCLDWDPCRTCYFFQDRFCLEPLSDEAIILLHP